MLMKNVSLQLEAYIFVMVFVCAEFFCIPIAYGFCMNLYGAVVTLQSSLISIAAEVSSAK